MTNEVQTLTAREFLTTYGDDEDTMLAIDGENIIRQLDAAGVGDNVSEEHRSVAQFELGVFDGVARASDGLIVIYTDEGNWAVGDDFEIKFVENEA